MQEPVVKHSYVQLNGTFVHLTQYCASDKQCLRFSTRHVLPKLIIFVPGNPGLLGIYHDFLLNLYRTSNNVNDLYGIRGDKRQRQQVNILAISHNDFDNPCHTNYKTEETTIIDKSKMNFVEKTIASKYADDPHHIELQVLNKLIILKRLLDVSTKIVFVGHSIGCYVILRLLQDRSVAAIHQGSILIHPALENLALTQKGSYYTQVFRYKLDYAMRAVAYVLDNIMPNRAKLLFLKLFASSEYVQRTSDIALESLAQLICRKTMAALIQMAKSELALVKDINSETLIKPHSSKLRLIYAINDHWVNTDNRKTLQEEHPDLYIEEQSRMHAFIMDPDTVMDYAVKVGLYVQTFYEPEPDSN